MQSLCTPLGCGSQTCRAVSVWTVSAGKIASRIHRFMKLYNPGGISRWKSVGLDSSHYGCVATNKSWGYWRHLLSSGKTAISPSIVSKFGLIPLASMQSRAC